MSIEVLPLKDYYKVINLMPGNMVVLLGVPGTCAFVEYGKKGGVVVREPKEGNVVKVDIDEVSVVVECLNSKI